MSLEYRNWGFGLVEEQPPLAPEPAPPLVLTAEPLSVQPIYAPVPVRQRIRGGRPTKGKIKKIPRTPINWQRVGQAAGAAVATYRQPAGQPDEQDYSGMEQRELPPPGAAPGGQTTAKVGFDWQRGLSLGGDLTLSPVTLGAIGFGLWLLFKEPPSRGTKKS